MGERWDLVGIEHYNGGLENRGGGVKFYYEKREEDLEKDFILQTIKNMKHKELIWKEA